MISVFAILALSLAPTAALRRAAAECPATLAAPAAPTIFAAALPIDVWGSHVYVKVCVAGREMDFILDTGAGSTSIDLNTAKQLGVRLGRSMTIGGAGAGRVGAARIDGLTATLAGSSITQPIALAIDLSQLPPREGHRIDGILGYDFIERGVLAIDYARRELRIYDGDAFHYDGPGTSMPVTLIDRFPHIDGAVTLADGETIPGRFVVDVGAATTLSLTKPFVDEHHLRERVGPTLQRRGSGGVGGLTTSETGRVASLSIGAINVRDPVVQLYGDSAGVLSRNTSWVGDIGGAILRRFTLFIDYRDKRLIFEPNATFNDPFEADMSGAALVMDDSLKTIIVYHVAPSSPASEAGLVAGDTIVAVDGGPAGRLELGELRERRFHRPNERVVLTVRRGGEIKSIEIVTRRLLGA